YRSDKAARRDGTRTFYEYFELFVPAQKSERNGTRLTAPAVTLRELCSFSSFSALGPWRLARPGPAASGGGRAWRPRFTVLGSRASCCLGFLLLGLPAAGLPAAPSDRGALSSAEVQAAQE